MNVQVEMVREALRELADAGFQWRVWTGNSVQVSSFEECAESLFTDSGLDNALERGVVFSVGIDARLALLGREVSKLGAYATVEELLAEPAFEQVRGQAREILELIQALPG